jgi:hypothetical protein
LANHTVIPARSGKPNDIDHATELAEFADELWNDRNLDKSIAKTNRGAAQ